MKKKEEQKKWAHRSYTREECLLVVQYWDTMTIGQIAEKINRPAGAIKLIAKQFRKHGFALAPKRVKGNPQEFWQSVATEAKKLKIARGEE